MLSEKALEIIREAARSGDNLGPYQEDKVRAVLDEMKTLFEKNQRDIEINQAITPAVHLRHAALERNKRCLMAYVYKRAEKVREMRWQFGAVLPSDIKANLSEAEATFFRRYNKDLAGYMRAAGDGAGVDLLTDLRPPKSLFVEVRCVKDYGELETDDGRVVVLKKNTQLYLPRAVCEPLIRQGILVHVASH